MIAYMMPDFIYGDKIYTYLSRELKNNSPKLYPNQKINFVYDCFPYAIWNGGTVLLDGPLYSAAEIKNTIQYYNEELDLPLAFTFTNPLISKTDCWDTYCNLIAELGHNGKNYILVSSPILEKYLRENYPNYKFCKSIIGNEGHTVDSNYEFNVLPRKYINNYNLLDTIPAQDRSKMEILATDTCPLNCPYWDKTHYEAYAKSQLRFNVNMEEVQCKFEGPRIVTDHIVTKKLIDDWYVPNGYTNFKISGRRDIKAITMRAINYFVLPEYRYSVLQDLI